MDLTHPNIIHLYGIVDEGTLCHSEYIHLNSNYRDNNPSESCLGWYCSTFLMVIWKII